MLSNWRDVASPSDLSTFLDGYAVSTREVQQHVLDEMVQFLDEYQEFERIADETVRQEQKKASTSRQKRSSRAHRPRHA